VASRRSKTFRYDKDGIHVLGVVNVAGATGEPASGAGRTSVSSRQRVRVVQRDGETAVSEEVSTSERQRSRTHRPAEPGKEERG
jgi:hypothetical protein